MTTSASPWDRDCLERKKFGELLLACLQAEAAFCEESFVVALTGPFGSGKSYFLEMWEEDLRQRATTEPDAFPLVVRVNAWESDFSGEPLLAVVSAIAKQLSGTQKGRQVEAIDELKRGVAGVLSGTKKVALDLLSGYIEGQTGVVLEEVADSVASAAAGNELDRRAKALFADFEARSRSLEGLRTSLQKFIEPGPTGGGALKLLLIVDELDRCHPRYAIEFLEAIKHVFNVKGLAVVLGVDWEQLGCTASALFGQNLVTEEYFRKFIKRKIPLPRFSASSTGSLIRKLHDKYFGAGNDDWKSLISSADDVPKTLCAMIHALDLSPRQQDSALHLLASFLRLEVIRGERPLKRFYFDAEFAVVLLWVRHPDAVQAFVRTGDCGMFAKFIRSLGLGEKLNDQRLNGDWIEGRILGTMVDEQNREALPEILRQAGYVFQGGDYDEARDREFMTAVKSVRPPGLLASIARRVTELDLFER